MTAQQFRRLEAPVRAAALSGTARQLCGTYPAYFHALGVDAPQLEPLCHAVADWAEEWRIVGERDIAQLCCIAVALGHQFWRDPRFGGMIAETLGSARLARTDATQLLVKKTGEWVAGLWTNDNLAAFAARLAHYVQANVEPSPHVLHAILPGHWIVLDAASNMRLIDEIVTALPPMPMPAQRLAGVGMALVHGIGWASDPQYGRLVQMVLTAYRPEDLARATLSFYGEIT